MRKFAAKAMHQRKLRTETGGPIRMSSKSDQARKAVV